MSDDDDDEDISALAVKKIKKASRIWIDENLRRGNTVRERQGIH